MGYGANPKEVFTPDTTSLYSGAGNATPQDLDVSGVVGANKVACLIDFNPSNTQSVYARTKGETELPLVDADLSGAISGRAVVATDANGFIQWRTTDNSGTIVIRMVGYWSEV